MSPIEANPLATLASGLLLGWSVAWPPGPINAEMIRRALARGFWPAYSVGLGACSGDFLWALGVALGAGARFRRHHILVDFLDRAGATGTRFAGNLGAAVRLAALVGLPPSGQGDGKQGEEKGSGFHECFIAQSGRKWER